MEKCEIHLLALKAFSNMFFCGSCEEKQLMKLCFVDSDPGQKVTHFNYMGDHVLKERDESHQHKSKRINILFKKVMDSFIKDPLSLSR